MSKCLKSEEAEEAALLRLSCRNFHLGSQKDAERADEWQFLMKKENGSRLVLQLRDDGRQSPTPQEFRRPGCCICQWFACSSSLLFPFPSEEGRYRGCLVT